MLMAKFRFLPEVDSIQGIAFEAFGKTERQLLQNSAIALEETIIDTKGVRNRVKVSLNLRATSINDLLFALLEHLIFLKDAKDLVFRDIKLGFEKQNKGFVLQGFAYGEKIDSARHKVRLDIKATARDLFEVVKTKTGFRAQVILAS